MSKKKSQQYLKYLQNRINSGVHPDKVANLLNIQPTSITSILRRNNLNIEYKGKHKSNKIINTKVFRNIKTEEEAYYLGFIQADGCIHILRNNYRLIIEIQVNDSYILNKLSNLLLNKTDVKYISKKNHSLFYLSSKEIYTNLTRYGILPNKTYLNYSFPYLPEELMPHFIRGYFDGDGCVYTKKQRYNWVSAVSFTGHYNFISSLEAYLKSRNILFTKVRTKQKKHQFDSVFEFEKKQDIKNLYTFMYKDANIYLTRKKDKFII